MSAELRVKELGLDLSRPPQPMANYVSTVRTGNLLYTSGQGPKMPDGSVPTGKLGLDMDVAAGYQSARQVAIGLISTVRAELGTLDRVKRVVKLLGMVNCAPDFEDQPNVINGASDLIVEVFGERGRHARSAVGMAALPNGIPVEIEMIIEVE